MKESYTAYVFAGAVLIAAWISATTPATAEDAVLERLLRTQAFDRVFDGFEFYVVAIEEDQIHTDGSREVTAVASGKFLDHVQRMKVLFLIVNGQVVGGQVLEVNGLPPCLPHEERATSSL